MPRPEEAYTLYLETRVADRDLLIEARKPIDKGRLMRHYLKRLGLKGLICRILDGEGRETERLEY